jgi:hypothetical protein
MTTQEIDFRNSSSNAQVTVVDGGFAVSNTGAGLAPNGVDQRLTVSSGVVVFSGFPTGTTQVLLTTETAECRYTLDGTAPTATDGHILAASEERVWSVSMVTAAKFIRTTTTNAIIHASPLKVG